ncbi:MAG: hypothetical protein D6701_14330 [Gemmatimonadetes bacterium]|nr:MAG: hypothetical protein D6701_14330 [Gemmatimonadota bacterium]
MYATTMVRLPVPEARSHLFEYGVLAMLVYHALLERRGNGRPVRWAAPSAVVVVTLVGWLDEVLQFFLPNRTYDLVDVGFNAIAATMGVGATALMGWARRWDVRLGRRRGGRAQ